MSEIDPDIQMPEEEPNTPEDQSSPTPPDETTDADAEETLENMQELIDQIDSLSKESDDDALKEIESQLPQNQEPEEGISAPDTVESDARQDAMANQADVPDGEPAIEIPESAEDAARTEAVIDSDIASDDDLALLLDDIDQVVVQAESEKSVTPGGENPVAGDVMSETMPEALSSPENPSAQEDSESALVGIANEAGEAGEVRESAGLDTDVDEIILETEILEATTAPSPAPETISTAPTSADSELSGLRNDLDDLIASAQAQPESEEKSESSESPAPTETVVSTTQVTDQSPEMAGEATPPKSVKPTTKPILEKQKEETPPTESKPHSDVTQSQQDIAMRALDEAMADDVAHMIAGDSEALESVLDGIFDEQAILVQNEEDFMNGSVPDGNIQTDQPVGDSGVKLVPPSSSPMEEATDIEEVIDEEIAALDTPETPKEISTTSVSDLPESDQKETEPVVQKPAEATKVADAAEVEAAPGEPKLAPAERESKWQDRVMAAFEIIEPPLVTVLSGLNYPLRKIPDRLRPAVDWLALSLVFWVPIVWVLAMFVVK